MTLAFPIRFEPDDGGYSAQGLLPFEGVITWGATTDEARFNAAEALTGLLHVRLDHGEPVPHPASIDEPDVEMIEPDSAISIPIQLRWAREAANLTQGELAARLGVTYQVVQKLERSSANPSIKTLNRVAKALGRKLTVAI
jgi:DNA-binding XRE family transcriptional regulator/predicted RNase H-like HicB family nuclease